MRNEYRTTAGSLTVWKESRLEEPTPTVGSVSALGQSIFITPDEEKRYFGARASETAVRVAAQRYADAWASRVELITEGHVYGYEHVFHSGTVRIERGLVTHMPVEDITATLGVWLLGLSRADMAVAVAVRVERALWLARERASAPARDRESWGVPSAEKVAEYAKRAGWELPVLLGCGCVGCLAAWVEYVRYDTVTPKLEPACRVLFELQKEGA